MAVFEGRHYQSGNQIRIYSENGFITKIKEAAHDSDLIIAPGLFDNQVNGYKGIGFTDPNLSTEGIMQVIDGMLKIGVTSFLPTMISAPMEILLRNLKIFRNLSVKTHNCVSTMIPSTIPGLHLEGPYLNPEPGYRGAHNPGWIRKPSIKEFDELFEASGGHICLLTLAPELPGAVDLIKHCKNLGVLVGLAHHNANTDQINAAVEAGAGLSVHLGNGIAKNISRQENPIWAQLAIDKLMISLIADGFHLTREELETFFKVKGPEKTILCSDCTDLAGQPPGEYLWDGKKVVLEPEGVIRFPEQKVLAGAASPLIRDIGVMMKFTGCSLAEAIDMASLNPARFHGITDRGELEVGQRADLILFKPENGNIQLQKTVKGGGLLAGS